MSRRREPASGKKTSPLAGATIGSIYGEAIGLRPGVVLGPPILKPKNLPKQKMAESTGVAVNALTNGFNVEIMQSGPGQDLTARSLYKPGEYAYLPSRALIRISVMFLRTPGERQKVLEDVRDAVVPKMSPEIRAQYEDEPPAIIQNQYCGNAWSSSAHFLLIGKENVNVTPLDFSEFGETAFNVSQGTSFTLNGKEWTWMPDPNHAQTPQHNKLFIKLFTSETADVTMEVDAQKEEEEEEEEEL